VRVKKVALEGPGVIIMTGPSSCGKGEVASALSKVLSLEGDSQVSMGHLLRTTVKRAQEEPDFRRYLAQEHDLGDVSIFESKDTSPELVAKVRSYVPEMEAHFHRTGMAERTTQLEWLEFCTLHGLLVPNRWTTEFIGAYLNQTPKVQHEPFILDGYPRTVGAAEHLLHCLDKARIPIIRVLHLSISKQEMMARAGIRGRVDDDPASLLSRYNFYIESVQPSVDYLKVALGARLISLIDAHQPVFDDDGSFNLPASINNVVYSALRALGVPRVIVVDLLNLGKR
jgi:adenylate kinase family enzyme